MSGSDTNCSCRGFKESGSAGGGVMGAGDRVVMLRIFFWNLSFSSTPAVVGARAQISGGAGVRAFAALVRPFGAYWVVQNARNQTGRGFCPCMK